MLHATCYLDCIWQALGALRPGEQRPWSDAQCLAALQTVLDSCSTAAAAAWLPHLGRTAGWWTSWASSREAAPAQQDASLAVLGECWPAYKNRPSSSVHYCGSMLSRCTCELMLSAALFACRASGCICSCLHARQCCNFCWVAAAGACRRFHFICTCWCHRSAAGYHLPPAMAADAGECGNGSWLLCDFDAIHRSPECVRILAVSYKSIVAVLSCRRTLPARPPHQSTRPACDWPLRRRGLARLTAGPARMCYMTCWQMQRRTQQRQCKQLLRCWRRRTWQPLLACLLLAFRRYDRLL